MRNWIIIGFLFLAFIQPKAQNLKLDAGKITQKEFFEEIPFELVHGKIVIPVTLEGQPYRFLLDTGAPNIISKSIRDRINPTVNKAIFITDANNKKQTMEVVPLPVLELGALRFEHGVAIVVDLENHPILKCYGLDGFIGSNFFKNVVLQIDYTAGKIRVSHSSKSFSIQTKGYPMQLIGQQLAPYVLLEHQSENGNTGSEFVLLDTGMDGLYDLSNRIYLQFKEGNVVATLSESTGVGSLGIFEKTEPSLHRLVRVQKMKLNATAFKNLITETTDDDNSRIGLKAFEYGKVTLDFNKKKWYYEVPETVEVNSTPKLFTPTLMNETLVVGIIWDESLKSKIQFGNKIVAINQQRLDSLPICSLLKMKEVMNGSSTSTIEIINNSGETVILNSSKQ